MDEMLVFFALAGGFGHYTGSHREMSSERKALQPYSDSTPKQIAKPLLNMAHSASAFPANTLQFSAKVIITLYIYRLRLLVFASSMHSNSRYG
jgi:hypothetical protein